MVVITSFCFAMNYVLFSALSYLFSELCYLKTAFLLANHNREIFSYILLLETGHDFRTGFQCKPAGKPLTRIQIFSLFILGFHMS